MVFGLVRLDRETWGAVCADEHDGGEPDEDAEPDAKKDASLGWSEAAIGGSRTYGLTLHGHRDDRSRVWAATGQPASVRPDPRLALRPGCRPRWRSSRGKRGSFVPDSGF